MVQFSKVHKDARRFFSHNAQMLFVDILGQFGEIFYSYDTPVGFGVNGTFYTAKALRKFSPSTARQVNRYLRLTGLKIEDLDLKTYRQNIENIFKKNDLRLIQGVLYSTYLG